MDGDFLQVKPRKQKNLSERSFVKTKMCIYFEKNGRCRNGDQCPYAHSKDELIVPPCHYGFGCRFKERCKFSHPDPVTQTPHRETIVFSVTDFPTLTPPDDQQLESLENGMTFRDACASLDGRKTLIVNADYSMDDMVQDVKIAVATDPTTVFDLCFK